MMLPLASLASAAGALAVGMGCDLVTGGGLGLFTLTVAAFGLGGAGAVASVRAPFRHRLRQPEGRFTLLAVAAAFALADAHAGAVTPGAQPFLMPITALLALAGGMNGIALGQALRRKPPAQDPSR